MFRKVLLSATGEVPGKYRGSRQGVFRCGGSCRDLPKKRTGYERLPKRYQIVSFLHVRARPIRFCTRGLSPLT